MAAFTDRQKLEELLVCQAWQMKEGQAMFIPEQMFNGAFPDSQIGRLIDGRPPEDRFLEKLPGVNYGAYKLHKDIITGNFTLSRHPCGTERVRKDYDKRKPNN